MEEQYLIGLFENRKHALEAVITLRNANFRLESIQMFTDDTGDEETRIAGHVGASGPELADALARAGVPEQEAQDDIAAVRQGATLMIVPVANSGELHVATNIFKQHNVMDTNRQGRVDHETGWTGTAGANGTQG
jgi:hypothetical protein